MASAPEKIGRLLVQQGLLTEEQLASCLREQTSNGTATLGQIIVSRGYIDAERLSRTLDAIGSLWFRCPEGCGRLEVKRPRLDTTFPCPKCGAPLETEDPQVSWVSSSEAPQPADPRPEEVVHASRDPKRVLGKYVLVRELGRGGSASVFKAWDSILHQYVALKLIGTASAGLEQDESSKEVQEFLREARTAVKLSHPNIVRVYEVGRQDGRYYLSMELIEGGSLAKFIHGRDATRRPKFYADPQRYLSILRDAARALDYAHHHHPPIVHRDVKPHNILVDPSGRACLADFGLAREMGGGGRLTVTGVTKGTPCYMAPEQARGGGTRLDGRTDVYGLGAILYEFLTGEPPFTGPSTHEILQKVVNEELVRPSQAIQGRGGTAVVPPALERIALKALEKDPSRRYPTASLFAADLDRYLAGRAVEASGASSVDRGLRWFARRRAVIIPAAIAVVMGIVALAALLRGPERVVERVVVQKEKPPAVETQFVEIDALADDLKFADALKACDKLRAATQDPEARARLAEKADDLRNQQQMLRGLVDRIRVQPRTYDRFSVGGRTLATAVVSDASMERVFIVAGGLRAGYEWSSVEPRQFVELVRDCWPDLDGKPALGLSLWARRHRVDATAKAPVIDSTSEGRYFKLLHEGERALADGDLALARRRFDHARALRPEGKEAREGLDRVTAAELKAPQPAPRPEPEPEPPIRALENPRLADEHHKKGSQLFDEGQYADAIEELTQAITYASKKGDSLASRGYAYYMLGNWKEARADFIASVAAGSWNDDYPQLFLWMSAWRLGQKDDATRALRTYAQQGARSPKVDSPWFVAVATHLTDDLSESELLRLSQDDTGVMKPVERQCEAYFYIGTKHLFAGNTGIARQWFTKSIQTNVTGFIEYKGSQAELDRLGGAAPATVAGPPLPGKRPAAVVPGASEMPPPPKLESNEKLILAAPQGRQIEVLSIAPDGSAAAYLESRGGKWSAVWGRGRLDGIDRVDACLWKRNGTPFMKVRVGADEYIASGSTLGEPLKNAFGPFLSPDRSSVVFTSRTFATDHWIGTLVENGYKQEIPDLCGVGFTSAGKVWYLTANGPSALGSFQVHLPGPIIFLPKLQGSSGQGGHLLALAPDSSTIAYPSEAGTVFAFAPKGQNTPSFNRVFAPKFSDDGKVFAYFAEMGSKKMLVSGVTQGVKYEDLAGEPVLSRDGKTIAYIAKRGSKWLVVHGSRPGEEFEMIKPKIYDVEQPVMSPDGKVVAYTADRNGLRSIMVNGKEVDSQPNAGVPAISADGKFVSYGFVTGPYFIWKTVPVPVR
jgi:lipoprotein NlpI